MNRRAAPRRDVVAIKRTGNWGNVVWQHELSCGHVELRKRKAAGGKLGCSRCWREAAGGTDAFLDIDEVDAWLDAELEADEVRRRLANRLRVPVELVQVVPTDGAFSATIVCPPRVVEKLLG